MCSLLYEYSNLEYAHLHVICRAHQAEDVIRILVAASQEYVNTYSTRRTIIHFRVPQLALFPVAGRGTRAARRRVNPSSSI